MEFLDQAVQKNNRYQKKHEKDNIIDPRMISIVQDFIIDNQLICYGGIAINNILPKDSQFYDYDIDIPDYDFFSKTAMKHAEELCDIFSKEDFVYHVEAKSAFFYGTYKVFVNFIPIADITQIHDDFYDRLIKTAIVVENIPYTHPDFLRMSLHQELSRPLGDVSRWEKIYTRMNILNRYYPITRKAREMTSIQTLNDTIAPELQKIVDIMITNGCIFNNMNMVKCLYKKYMSKKIGKNITCKKSNIHSRLLQDQFIVFCDDISSLNKSLKSKEIGNIEIQEKKSIYKFIKKYEEVFINNTFVGIIFELDSCMSYHNYEYKSKNIRIGNLDTILHLYFSIVLMDDVSINTNNVYDTISFLYDIIMKYEALYIKYLQNKEAHSQPKELIRFNLPCLGTQSGYVDILKERFKKFKELKNKKNTIEYKQWFFKYIPSLSNKVRQDKTNEDKGTRKRRGKLLKKVNKEKTRKNK